MCGYSNMLSLIDNSNLSDNDKIQKRNELFFLSEFINYSEKDIAIVPKLREKPDFEVSYKGNSVGVEIRILPRKEGRKGSLVMQEEKAYDRILDEVHTECLERFHLNLWFSAYFVSKPTKKLKLMLLDELTRIDFAALKEGEYYKIDVQNKLILSLSIMKLPPNMTARHECMNNTISFTPELKKSMFLKVIEEKESLLPSYRDGRLQHIMLLIASDASHNSGRFYIKEPFDFSDLQSAFCGIYYYSHLSDTRITTIKSLEI